MPTFSEPAAASFKDSAAATFSSLRTLQSTITATAKALPAAVTSTALSIPHTYSTYVASHTSSVGQVESALRSLTYLLPGARLHDSELAFESIQSFIQLLSIYHDHLLKSRADLIRSSPALSKAPSSPKPRPTPHLRYTQFWSNASPLYARVATLLKVIQYTELLWEMIARRRGGERGRWRIVVLLESFKALCRLILMRLTGSRPLINPPLPTREEIAPLEEEHQTDSERDSELEAMVAEGELAQLEPEPMVEDYQYPYKLDATNGIPTPPLSESGGDKSLTSHVNSSNSSRGSSASSPYHMPRTHLTLPPLPSPPSSSNITSYLLNQILTPDDLKPAYALLHHLSSLKAQAAEVLYILRPLIYVLLMQRVARSYGYEGRKWRKVWMPWIAGVGIEYLARALAENARSSSSDSSSSISHRFDMSALERDELRKRGWGMAWWGMRGAFYENVTKGVIEGVRDTLKGKAFGLGDLVGGVVEDYEWLWGEYWNGVGMN